MTSLTERIERLRQGEEKQRIEEKEKAKQLALLKKQKETELAAEVQSRAAPFINIINELQIIDLFKELIEGYDLKATSGGTRPAEVNMFCMMLSGFSWMIDVQTGKVGIKWFISLDDCLEKIDRLKKGKDKVEMVGCHLLWNQYAYATEGGNKVTVHLAKEKNDLLLKIIPGGDEALILTKSDWSDKQKVVDSLARAYGLMDTHFEHGRYDEFHDSLRR